MPYWKKSCITTFSAIDEARIKIAQYNIVLPLRVLLIVALFMAFYCITTGYVAASCECNAGGTCYDVTNDTSFDSVPWLNLSPGDTVRIHYRATPYQRNVALDDSGTIENPITICGVADPDNNRPTISGSGTGPGGDPVIYIGGTANIKIEGLILTQGRRGIESDGWPGSDNIVISNNEIFNNGDTIPVDSNHGGGHGGGILIAESSNISLSYNIVRNNFANGAGAGMWIDEASTATLDHELVYNNLSNRYGAGIGVDERYRLDPSHAVITNSTIAYNYSTQDRSSGLVFRYNWIESTARTMDMVEAEDGAPILIYEPDYDKTNVYGNIIIDAVDENDDYVSAVNIIHYGGDNNVNDSTGLCARSLGGDPACRTGTLYFFNNTVIVKDYRDTLASLDWKQTRVFEMRSTGV